MDLIERRARIWTRFNLFRTGLLSGCCEHGDEPSCSI